MESITFGDCNFPQKIKNSIAILRLINFGYCNSPQKSENFVDVLELKTFKDYSTPQDKGVKPIIWKLSSIWTK